MVHDKIDNDIDSPLMACRDQIFKIVHRTVFRVNITVIRHIIFMVGCGRHDRHQPDSVTSKIRICRRITVIDII